MRVTPGLAKADPHFQRGLYALQITQSAGAFPA
jgi:hypothetical protein